MRLDRLEGEVIAERFRLIGMVGKGGYGAVFEAEQLSVGRRCAVKILLPTRADDETVEKRFRAEAKVTSRLTHPNSVVLYDFGVDETTGYLFLATEYLDGVTLDEVLKTEGRLGIERSLRIMEQIAASLDDAHEMGLVHRDVKPKNIMLVERASQIDFVKVIDFGIAKALHMTSDLTATGTLIGTPQYMSPEQLLGHKLDGRSDQYALAVMGYKMLTGRNPFRAASTMDTAMNHVHQRPMPLRSYCPGIEVNRDVEDIFLQALEKAPDHRFEDISVFVRALKLALSEGGDTLEGESTEVFDRPEETGSHVAVEEVDSEDESSGEGSDGMMVFETRGFTRGTQLVGDVEELLEEVERSQGRGEVEEEEEKNDESGKDSEEDERGGVQVPTTADRPAPMTETASVEVEARSLEQGERRGETGVPTRVAALGLGVLAVLVGTLGTIVVVGGEEGIEDTSEGLAMVTELEEGEETIEGEEEEVVGDSAEDVEGEAEEAALEKLSAQRIDALSEARAEVNKSGEVAMGSMVEAAQRLRQERLAREREQVRVASGAGQAEQEEPGTVVVTMIPWGELVVDGVVRGEQTRQELELEAGRRRLELVQRGEVRAIDEVEVRSGERREVVLRVE